MRSLFASEFDDMLFTFRFWLLHWGLFAFCLLLRCHYGFCPSVIARLKEAANNDQLSRDKKNLNLTHDCQEVSNDGTGEGKAVLEFSFMELMAATGNFRSDCFLGEGGFGKVYKGYLERINQVS